MLKSRYISKLSWEHYGTIFYVRSLIQCRNQSADHTNPTVNYSNTQNRSFALSQNLSGLIENNPSIHLQPTLLTWRYCLEHQLFNYSGLILENICSVPEFMILIPPKSEFCAKMRNADYFSWLHDYVIYGFYCVQDGTGKVSVRVLKVSSEGSLVLSLTISVDAIFFIGSLLSHGVYCVERR